MAPCLMQIPEGISGIRRLTFGHSWYRFGFGCLYFTYVGLKSPGPAESHSNPTHTAFSRTREAFFIASI